MKKSCSNGEAKWAVASAREPDRDSDGLRDLLHELREIVRFHEYDTVHAVHCYELAPRWLPPSLRQTLNRAPADTADLLRLFYFGEPIGERRATEVFGRDLLDRLIAANLLCHHPPHNCIKAYLRLDVIGDTLLLNRFDLDPVGAVYYGEDSQFLRSIIRPRVGDKCLDLCTGTGVQSLRCAPLASHVDAVDLNPAAVELARMNVILNDWENRVDVHLGDLWEPFPAGEAFDHIVCNPPLMPVPDLQTYPLYGHGGADGMSVVRRILKELPERLSNRGRLTLIGACIGDEGGPVILEDVDRYLPQNATASVYLLLKTPLSDWANAIARTVNAFYGNASTIPRVVMTFRNAFGGNFRSLYVFTYLVKVCNVPGQPRSQGSSRVFDYSTVGAKSYWYVNRGNVAP